MYTHTESQPHKRKFALSLAVSLARKESVLVENLFWPLFL